MSDEFQGAPSRPIQHNERFLSIALLVMLSGCGQSDSSGPQDVSNKMPPIHVDQTVELLFDGNNSVRETYKNTIRDCLAAGLQSRALSEEDIALVGVTRYEAWFAQDMEVIRERSWQVVNDGPDGTCLFRLQMTGLQETTTSKHYEQIDLATGERNVEPSAADALFRMAAEKEEEEPGLGFEGPQRKTVAGQPCNEWVNPSSAFKQCVWTGGKAWGFTPGGLNDHRPSRNFIVLEQMPLNGQGYKVFTTNITIGRVFEPSQLKNPASEDRN